jgi:hypothetical protein
VSRFFVDGQATGSKLVAILVGCCWHVAGLIRTEIPATNGSGIRRNPSEPLKTGIKLAAC